MAKRKKWGERFPGLTARLERHKQLATFCQIQQLKELAALRRVRLVDECKRRYNIDEPQWLYKAQAAAWIKEMRDD